MRTEPLPGCIAGEALHLAPHLALKSGNFGGTGFFTRTFDRLEAQ